MADKITKLTSTVYNVLEFFPYEDPLKIKAKEKALAIMENLTLVFEDYGWVSLKECFSGSREKIKFQIIEDIDIFLNYLKLARLQGWINGINFLIIFNEYEKIRKEIKPKSNPIFRSIEFSNLSETGLPEEKPVNNASPVKKSMEEAKKEVSLISERQKKIIKVLEEKGNAQVMDFKTVLGDITKRTIRRDLDELLKMGKITREGEFNHVFYKISD